MSGWSQTVGEKQSRNSDSQTGKERSPDGVTLCTFEWCGMIRFVRLGHKIYNPKFDQNPLRIE